MNTHYTQHIAYFVLMITTYAIYTQKNDIVIPDITTVSFEAPKTASSRSKRHEVGKNSPKKLNKVITDMNYEELLDARDRYKTNKNTNGYTKTLELLIKLATETDALAEHMIELADAYYSQQQYKKAALLYNEFILFYKGHEKIEYAHFQAIQSLEKLLLPFDRDQTRTQELLSLIESYLSDGKHVQYRDQILTLQKKCRELMFESKKNACQFYLTYNNVPAAITCIHRLRDEWIELLPEKESDMLTLEIALAEKQQNNTLIEEKQLLLVEKFPEATTETVVAQNNRKQRLMRDRF